MKYQALVVAIFLTAVSIGEVPLSVAQQQRRGVGQWMKEEWQEYKEGVKERWREQREERERQKEQRAREKEERERERMERARERERAEDKFRGYVERNIKCIGEWKSPPSPECR